MARTPSAQSVRRAVVPRPVLFRALRAAIVIPGVFAIGTQLLGSATIGLFASIGSVSMLLFVDFGGSIRQRAQSQAGLVIAGLFFVALGTLCSRNIWLATSVTLIVAFAVLFSGVVSSVLAGAQPAVLISFLLPVTFPAPVDLIPDRMLGWLLAGIVSGVAILLIPPHRKPEPLRSLAAEACARLGEELSARGTGSATGAAEARDDQAASDAAVAALRNTFFAAPYRPSGLSRSARAVVQIAEQVIALHAGLDRRSEHDREGERATFEAIGVALQRSGGVLASDRSDLEALRPCRTELRRARENAERAVVDAIPDALAGASGQPRSAAMIAMLDELEPAFATQDAAQIADAIVEQVQSCAEARQRSWWHQLMDRSAASSARDRIGAHVDRRSVWLRNSIRGALGFAATVFVADLLGVEHAFWVVFGTLAVLRSNAANTGQSAIRAIAGTLLGLVIGIPLVLAIGGQVSVNWMLLPIAVAFTAIASSLSFTVGQASFTVTLLLLFGVVEPVGLQIGIVRIEDVALGCAVSVLVTLLLWPRGAAARLNQALSNGFDTAAQFLSGATQFALLRGYSEAELTPPPDDDRAFAADSARRLDDAFRQFLSERGAKSIDLSELTSLVVAIASVRRLATAICDLWERDDEGAGDPQTAARSEILLSQAVVVGWYRHAAAALAQNAPAPDPPAGSGVTASRLLDAFRRDLGVPDADQALTAFKLAWTNHHIRVAAVIARDIAPAVSAAVEMGVARNAWLFPVRRRSRLRAAVA